MIKISNKKEEKLLEKAKNDDENAITEIYNKYKHFVYNKAYPILYNVEDAKEAVSVTFARFLNNKDKIKFVPLYKWFSIVTRNVCYDMFKGKAYEITMSDYSQIYEINSTYTIINNYTQDPAVIYDQEKANQEINCILAELPEKYEKVLRLQHDGYSNTEISNITGETYAAVSNRLSRAKKKAQALLIEKASWLLRKNGINYVNK